ncbi:MAG TPA: TonB-dependent receptor plug domain-containing protein, partial [Caulobacteraceae bacterium]
MKLRTALLTGVSTIAALSGSAALAQQAAAPAQSAQVEEIVVTATKRETNLQNTPIAISAFSQKTLSRQQVKDVTDLARFVPSLAFSQHADQGSINLTMRGIGNDAAFTEVADPEVAIYIDGIYSPRAQGASVLMYDMDRVEVDRGPQGTLYGRNATVGAINLITARPEFNGDHGSFSVVGGSYNRLGATGMLNMPVSDTLAFRLAFMTEQHDGYADYQQPPNVPGVEKSAFVTSGKKYYAQDQKSVRGSALWKPNDRFTWNLNAEGYLDTGAPVIDLMQTPRAGQSMWSTLSDTAPETNRYTYGVRSQMDYALTDKIGVSYIAGYQRTGGSANNDSDAGALPPTSATTPGTAFQEDHTVWSQYDAYSHEIQLKSTGKNTVDWILGGYFSHETNKIRFDIDQRNGYRLGTFGWAGSFIQQDREIESKAVFGQAVWHVSDRIRLTGGVR